MTPRRLLAASALVLALAARPDAAVAQGLPRFTAPVVDAARAVPDDLEQRLNAALEDYRRRSGNQVAAAVVRTTGRQSIEDYAEDLFDEWGVGTKGEDNGVLLVVAVDDRKVRIEVGFGVEDELTDIESGRIIDQRLIPLLRAGEVGPAVEQGTGAIRQALGDESVGALPAVPLAEPPGGGEGEPSFGGLFPLLLLGFAALSVMGNRRGRRRWGGGFPIIWGGGLGGGGGGWGGGGFGGGGFGGGGGGGSGGGGASGSW